MKRMVWSARLKPLIAVWGLVGITWAATAAGPKFRRVQVVTAPTGTTLTVFTSAPFAETAYRPSPKLLLVDLHNVSLAKEEPLVHLPRGPVTSYRMYTYKGANDEQVVRMEIGLDDSAQPSVEAHGSELVVKVGGAGSHANPVAAAPVTPEPTASAAREPAPVRFHAEVAHHSGRGRLIGVHVESSNRGVVLLLRTSGTVPEWKSFPLHHPERVVIDLPGLSKAVAQEHWTVGQSGLKDVRVGQFNSETVRIVLDLTRGLHPVIGKTADGIRIVLPMAPNQISSAARTITPATPVHFQPANSFRPVHAATMHLTGYTVPLRREEPRMPAVNASSLEAAPEPTLHPSAPAAAPARGDPPPTAMASAPASERPPVSPAPVMHRASTPVSPFPPPAQTSTTPQTPRGEAPLSLIHSLESQASAGAVPYTGQHISLNLKDADIKDFFRLVHEISGLNLVIDPNVQGTVTMVLNDIPWDQALDLVLRNNQLGRQLEGNVVRIATIKTLQAEAAQQAELVKVQEAAVPLQTEVKALSYAKAADLITPLKQFLGSRDSITPEPRTNTLLIQSTPDKIPLLNQLIARLDQKTPQVEVEARVVAASRNFSRELGVQLGFGAANSTTAVGGVPGVGISPTPVTGLTPKFPTVGGSLPFNVNLPANAPTSGLGFITATNSYRIDALLSAAEQRGLGHVLSRPKVITQNNAQAIVQQGVKIPVQTTINNTISVQFFNVTLRLAVTPQITADNTVFLQVDIENDQIDPGIPRIQGIPAIDTQQTTTNVLVQNGATVVIGGVMTNNNQNNVQQVPLLGSLPVVGNLFKHSSIQNNSQELLFFLTPRILKS